MPAPAVGAPAPVSFRRLARALLAAELALLLVLAAGTHGWIVRLPRPVSTDFVSFDAAGTLAREGRPAAAYDRASHHAAEQRLTEPGIPYQFFFYPPTFLLLCAPLAALPYLVAFGVFELATLAAWLAAMRAIAPPLPGRLAALLCLPSALWCVGLGQNAFLTAALMGAGTVLVDRAPILAGAAFGALCIKPHMLALVPVALLAGARWRALAACTGTVTLLILLTLLLWGAAPWRGFALAIASAPSIFTGGYVRLAGQVSVAGASLRIGMPPILAGAAQALAALMAITGVALAWRPGGDQASRGATLAAGTLLVMPVALFYDLLLAAVAAAWILRAATRRGGPTRGEAWALAALVAADLCAYPVSLAMPLPLGAAIAPMLLGWAMRQRVVQIDENRRILNTLLFGTGYCPPVRPRDPGRAPQTRRFPSGPSGALPIMTTLLTFLSMLRADRRGVTALEYGIIAGVLGLVLITVFTGLGTSLTGLFTNIEKSL